MDVSNEDLEMYVILPLMAGVIGGCLTACIGLVVEVVQKIRENRERQHMRALELCTNVVGTLDALTFHLKHHAWYIAWGKHRMRNSKVYDVPIQVQENSPPRGGGRNDVPGLHQQQQIDSGGMFYYYPDELFELQKEKWQKLLELIDDWRSNAIGYETRLKASFGSEGYPAFLFLQAKHLLEDALAHIERIFYAPPAGTNNNNFYVATFDRANGGKPIMGKLSFDDSGAGQLASMEEYFGIITQLEDRVAKLSSTMIDCIQKQAIGNLSRTPIPIPDDELQKSHGGRGEIVALSRGEVFVNELQQEVEQTKLKTIPHRNTYQAASYQTV